ncbi:hypothetical protein BV898_08068 [Hypsibius exemplaris]|uniref:Uncharacterized protein n=1 Tax=Hypsibius exemplaris TaxID=2072580 RepID=A0A1W0WRW3_HYPEX|nr:hypothetical protein BV898_08068 [Hypsibius exemplaris]
MFARKLRALGYEKGGIFNIDDRDSLRHLVIWLEDRIFCTALPKHLQQGLRNQKNPQWRNVFSEYLNYCGCPFPLHEDASACCLDWLLREAIRLCVPDDRKQPMIPPKREKTAGPFENIDWGSREFYHGISKMAAMLNVPTHPDAAYLLTAVAQVLKARRAVGMIDENGAELDGLRLEEVTLGFDQQDKKLWDACRILRLLHIQQLRGLQTQIDAALVAVQIITADPLTDSALGRTGF